MKYFGTDGIRDRVDGPLLKEEFVYRLGRAIGRWLNKGPADAARHVVIGRDTRASGASISLCLARGLDREGVRIFDGGICPTPAVAVAVRLLDLDAGIVITASHNPSTDNGIKVFGPGGCKLTDQDEAELEAFISGVPDEPMPVETPPMRAFDARRHYLDVHASILPQNALVGMRIVLDCANGATHRTSPELLEQLGAHLVLIGCEPDGDNINEDLGSEHPEVMARSVLEHGAQLGIAHDGDGDRVILCDHRGTILDGDAVLAVLASGWAGRGLLEGNAIVATIMSNLGLDSCLRASGVQVERVGVGDRQVFYKLKESGLILGGESSGHFISMNHLPTGDGLLAALLVLREMVTTGRSLADLARLFRPFPQLKQNLVVEEKPVLEDLPELQAGLKLLEASLEGKGRILLRYSGTEPKIRLLAEAEDEALAQQTMDKLESLVRQHLTVAH